MSTPTLTSLMLSSTDPERLHTWYTTVLPPATDDRRTSTTSSATAASTSSSTAATTSGRRPPSRAGSSSTSRSTTPTRSSAGSTRLGSEWLAPLEDRDGSLFATAIDPDGNYVQLIQLSEEHKQQMAEQAGA